MNSFLQDLRFTFRQMKHSPGFALTAILTLALGIGATTAMLAIVDSVLLRPLDYPHGDRLMSVDLGSEEKLGESEQHGGKVSFKNFQDLQHSARSFDSLSLYTAMPTPIKRGS